MPVLHRSRSTAAREAKEPGGKKDEVATGRGRPSLQVGEQKKVATSPRPKTADERHRSFSRPRTANAPGDRVVEQELPVDIIEFRSGHEIYSFPTPSPRLPPKSATFHHSPSPSPSPLVFQESPHIGMALGSPSQAPMPNWGRSHTIDHLPSTTSVTTPLERVPPFTPEKNDIRPQRPELKKKTSNWKSIRDMFGRKPSRMELSEPFYRVRMPEPQNTDRSAANSAASPHIQTAGSMRTRIHQRTPSMTRGMARLEARAQADLASFQPPGRKGKLRSPSVIQKEGFSPMFRALGTQRESEEMFSPSAHERNDSPLSTSEKLDPAGTPRINLDLPSWGFDRYSVMFEKVLEDPKPSLLERRQSKLPRKKSLKTIEPIESISEQVATSNESKVPAAPQRSLTSPSLLKSRLSIKVSNKSRPAARNDHDAGALHRPRPIGRSNTAPPNSQSPIAAAFKKATKTAIFGLTPTSATFSQISENSLPPTPNTATTAFSDKDSVAIISNTVKPALPDSSEPSWDMMTSVPVRTQSHRHDRERQHSPYLRVKSPEDLEKQIVQVSVARQVSVSKARRTVQHAMKQPQQPLRPRVVVMGGREKERKSTMVLIEGGDD